MSFRKGVELIDVYNAIMEANKRYCLREEGIEYELIGNKPRKRYDKGYKSLFSVKKNFIDFVRDFMKISFNEEISEENITLLDKEFITSNFEKRESDVIYEVRNNKKVVSYFVLIEIQSKVDKFMAYRLLNYMLEIWRRWYISEENKEYLPKIIPCVLYNGKNKWSAPIEFREMYKDFSESEEYLVNFKYILIDINRYDAKDLVNMGNVISSAFYLDMSKKEEFGERIKDLGDTIKKLDNEAKENFLRWVINVFSVSEENVGEIEDIFGDGGDVVLNISRIGREFYREWKKEGLEEGRSEGRKEGREEGKLIAIRETIKKLVALKLKVELKKTWATKIDKASVEKLEKIENEIFNITSWKEVDNILNS